MTVSNNSGLADNNIRIVFAPIIPALDNKLILQGAEDGREGVRDGLGWTLSVAGDTGHMVLTASGEDVGFVIFGVCAALPKRHACDHQS